MSTTELFTPTDETPLLPMRTAAEQWDWDGGTAILSGTHSSQGLAYVSSIAGACVMALGEWHLYEQMRDRDRAMLKGAPVISMQQQTADDPLDAVPEFVGSLLGDADLLRIYESLRISLGEARDAVTRAQGNLSVEDYGAALAFATEKLSLSIGCVQGLERRSVIASPEQMAAIYARPSHQSRDEAIRSILVQNGVQQAEPPAWEGLPALEPGLWCVHVSGADEYLADVSKDEAERHAAALNKIIEGLPQTENTPTCKATVKPWPFSAESHAEAMRQIAARATKGGSAA